MFTYWEWRFQSNSFFPYMGQDSFDIQWGQSVGIHWGQLYLVGRSTLICFGQQPFYRRCLNKGIGVGHLKLTTETKKYWVGVQCGW